MKKSKSCTVFLYCLLSFFISWSAKLVFRIEDLGRIPVLIPKGVLQLIASYGPSLAGLIT